MPGKNKTPMVGWHPRADLWPRLEARIKHVAARLGGDGRGAQSEVLNEMAQEYLDRRDTTTEPEGEK